MEMNRLACAALALGPVGLKVVGARSGLCRYVIAGPDRLRDLTGRR